MTQMNTNGFANMCTALNQPNIRKLTVYGVRGLLVTLACVAGAMKYQASQEEMLQPDRGAAIQGKSTQPLVTPR